jgi:hypothetical protein
MLSNEKLGFRNYYSGSLTRKHKISIRKTTILIRDAKKDIQTPLKVL